MSLNGIDVTLFDCIEDKREIVALRGSLNESTCVVLFQFEQSC